jgi:IQ calmodulin-binding motif
MQQSVSSALQRALHLYSEMACAGIDLHLPQSAQVELPYPEPCKHVCVARKGWGLSAKRVTPIVTAANRLRARSDMAVRRAKLLRSQSLLPSAADARSELVEVWFNEGQKAGLRFDYGPVSQYNGKDTTAHAFAFSVAAIEPGSAADRHPDLTVGMLLWAINGASMQGLGVAAIMSTMAAAGTSKRCLTFTAAPAATPLAGKSVRFAKPAPDFSRSGSAIGGVNAAVYKQQPRHIISRTVPTEARRFSLPSMSEVASVHDNSYTPFSSIDARRLRKTNSDYLQQPDLITATATAVAPPLHFADNRNSSSNSNAQAEVLYDRRHVLGEIDRSIVFEASHAAIAVPRHLSLASLEAVSKDWMKDPYSTPARRRRLIHEVSTAVVARYFITVTQRVTLWRTESAAAVVIQSNVRSIIAVRRYEGLLQCRRLQRAIMLQAWWRGNLDREHSRALRIERRYHIEQSAAVKIQQAVYVWLQWLHARQKKQAALEAQTEQVSTTMGVSYVLLYASACYCVTLDSSCIGAITFCFCLSIV